MCSVKNQLHGIKYEMGLPKENDECDMKKDKKRVCKKDISKFIYFLFLIIHIK